MGLSAYLVAVHLWSWISMSSFYLGGHSDFRQIYAAAYMVRTGRAAQLYDPAIQEHVQNSMVGIDQVIPFIRPAYELLIFLPVSRLPYRAAYFTVLACNLILLAMIYKLLRSRLQNLTAIFPWIPAALLLGFLPIGGALLQGQDSILLMFLLLLAMISLERNRDVWAGIFVGLGLFKFQLTLPLAAIFFLWRRSRFVIGFLSIAALAVLTSITITGIDQARTYFRLLFFMAQPAPVESIYPLTISRMTNFHGAVFATFGHVLSVRGIFLATAAVSLAWVAWLWRNRPATKTDEFLLALMAATLLSYYLFFHDVSPLIIPIALLLNRNIMSETSGDRQGRIIVRSATILFVIPLLLSYAPNYLFLTVFPLTALAVASSRLPEPCC
jgi:Glycosyltransferase family 87